MVLEACGLSRGALYHHFASKEALFVAVLEDVEAGIAARLRKAAASAPSAEEALVAGCTAFLRIANDATVRQIVLIDAPAVVGWERWREIDGRYGYGLLRTGLAALVPGTPAAIDLLAHVLLAALLELALVVARSKKPKSAVQDGERLLRHLIRSFAEQPPEQAP
jgi:AcrR family transcriptional regulator